MTHEMIALLKKSILDLVNIILKNLILKFGVVPSTNKEIVAFIKLHSYKIGLVYLA